MVTMSSLAAAFSTVVASKYCSRNPHVEYVAVIQVICNPGKSSFLYIYVTLCQIFFTEEHLNWMHQSNLKKCPPGCCYRLLSPQGGLGPAAPTLCTVDFSERVLLCQQQTELLFLTFALTGYAFLTFWSYSVFQYNFESIEAWCK